MGRRRPIRRIIHDMKTYLVTLAAHDSVISIQDRLSWAKAPRILLIWPKGERVPLRALDLKLLQRHARRLGADLGLMTRDRHIRREARALGLPVFSSLQAAQRTVWPQGRSRLRRRRRRSLADLQALREKAVPQRESSPLPMGWRIAVFSLGLLAVLLLVSFFLPRAAIHLRPQRLIQKLTLPVVADPGLRAVFVTGSLPSREMQREVQGTLEQPVSGEVAVPEVEAQGQVIFRNLTDSSILIPQGTIVHTLGVPSIRFQTTQSVEIPAGRGKTATVTVESIAAGARGNLESGLIQGIEGPLSLSLAVTNPEPTSGGRDRLLPAPSAEDRLSLRQRVMADLQTRFQTDLASELPPGSVLFPDTLREVAVFEETYFPPPGGTGSHLSLTLRVRFAIRYASGEDLLHLATQALNAALARDYTPLDQAPTLRLVGDPPATDPQGRTHFLLEASRPVIHAVDAHRALFLVQGRPLAQAHARLAEAFSLSEPPQIDLWPSWWPWLPLTPLRVSVRVIP